MDRGPRGSVMSVSSFRIPLDRAAARKFPPGSGFDFYTIGRAQAGGGLALAPDTLCSPDRGQSVRSARAALSFVLVRRLGYRVADVAAARGRDPATIRVAGSHLARRLESSDSDAAVVARLSQNV